MMKAFPTPIGKRTPLFAILFFLFAKTCLGENPSPTPGPTSDVRVRVSVKSRVVLSVLGQASALFPPKEQDIFRKSMQLALGDFITSMNDVRVLSYQLTSPTSAPTFLPTPRPTLLPSAAPSPLPTTLSPSTIPSPLPSMKPSPAPSPLPSMRPTSTPTWVPSCSSDEFESFDSSLWSSQCSGCSYSGGSLFVAGDNQLMRTLETQRISTIKAEFTKDADCDDHFVVLSTDASYTWNWGSVAGAVSFAFNCNAKYIYGQSASTSVECNIKALYSVDISVTSSSVSFVDDNCGTLSLVDSIGTEKVYVYVGADADSPDVAEWHWIEFSSDENSRCSTTTGSVTECGSMVSYAGLGGCSTAYSYEDVANEWCSRMGLGEFHSYSEIHGNQPLCYLEGSTLITGTATQAATYGCSMNCKCMTSLTCIRSRRRLRSDDTYEEEDEEQGEFSAVIGGKYLRRRELLSATTVNDIDVDFEFNSTTSVTNVAVLTSLIYQELVHNFQQNKTTGLIPFDAHLLEAAAALGYQGTNSTAGTREAGAINVLQPGQQPEVIPDMKRFVTARPTPQPTGPMVPIDAAMIEAAAAVVAGAIGASVGASIGASVGGSSGGGGGGGGGGNNAPSGDPLSLVFLIQAIAVTSKLSCMAEAYSAMVGGFAMFNLQISPPGPLKQFWKLDEWAPWWFSDKTEASTIFSGHLFWSLLGWISTATFHQLQLFVLKHILDFPVPGFLQFPQVEIVALLVMSMGILDTSAAVLMMASSAWGWKILAIFEVSCVFLFLRWFLRQQKKFLENVEWNPAMNVAQMKLFNVIDADGDGNLSLDEMLAARRKLGLTEGQARHLFAELDLDGNGTVSAEEFREFYKDKKITFAHTTCFEGLVAMLFTPRRRMGKWVPIKDAEAGSQRFAQFFAKFTPMQTSYYFMNMTRQVFEALLLNGAQPFPAVQVIALALVNLFFGYSVSANKAYTLIAQSRADMWTAIGRALTYLVALLAYYGFVPMQDAVWAMILNQSLMIFQAIFTQMYPVFVSLLDWLYSKFLWPFILMALKIVGTRQKESQQPGKGTEPKIISIVSVDTPARTPTRQELAEKKHVRRTSKVFDLTTSSRIGTSLDRPLTPKSTEKQLWIVKEPPARNEKRWEENVEIKMKSKVLIDTPAKTPTRQEMAEMKHLRRASQKLDLRAPGKVINL